jgi:hypothetical protein
VSKESKTPNFDNWKRDHFDMNHKYPTEAVNKDIAALEEKHGIELSDAVANAIALCHAEERQVIESAAYSACAACGKLGKNQGEVIDNKDHSITHPICGHCCAMWDDVDTKDDVWSAICVRRNSGEYMPVCQPKKEG